jgi:hypothetical protein
LLKRLDAGGIYFQIVVVARLCENLGEFQQETKPHAEALFGDFSGGSNADLCRDFPAQAFRDEEEFRSGARQGLYAEDLGWMEHP